MRKLVIFFLFALPLSAQKVPGYDPRTAMDNIKKSTMGHYESFSITKIPKSCSHPHKLFGVEVCRIYVKYPHLIAKPIFFIEDWTDPNEADHSHGQDTVYHVGLINPTQQGVYIEGRPGHRIWWEVHEQ